MGAPFWRSFRRSQLSSALATAVDFGLVFGLTELAHFWYVLSVAIGAAVGALVNFAVNRHWSFRHADPASPWRYTLHGQARRYTLVSTGSLVLNSAGTWLVTESLEIPYGISVIGVSLVVGFFFNFPLQRRYVFG